MFYFYIIRIAILTIHFFKYVATIQKWFWKKKKKKFNNKHKIYCSDKKVNQRPFIFFKKA